MNRCQSTLITVLVVFVTSQAVSGNRAAPVPGNRSTPAARLVTQPRVLVIAHRGASRLAPENTLPAFREAVRAGADLVELDYYHSADRVPVVFHDKRLDRTTDSLTRFGRKGIPVETKTLAELRQLDAGSWFDRKFTGTRIPTLEESLAVIQNGSMTLIERKGGDAGTCVSLLKSNKILDRVVVQSFDWDYVSDCRRASAKLTLAALGSKQLTAERLDEIQATGAQVVAWSHKDLDRDAVSAVHARGLRVWTYTVNDPMRARQLIRWGIDGIITDDPAGMKQVVGEHLTKQPAAPVSIKN